MGTRSIWTFKDTFGTAPVHVFVHYDGYPLGAADYLRQTLESGKTWNLPRYEADEFAAGFIASIKTGGGNVRCASRRTSYADVEFGYTVTNRMDTKDLQVVVTSTDFWGDKPKETRLWSGSIHEFEAWARAYDEAYA